MLLVPLRPLQLPLLLPLLLMPLVLLLPLPLLLLVPPLSLGPLVLLPPLLLLPPWLLLPLPWAPLLVLLQLTSLSRLRRKAQQWHWVGCWRCCHCKGEEHSNERARGFNFRRRTTRSLCAHCAPASIGRASAVLRPTAPYLIAEGSV